MLFTYLFISFIASIDSFCCGIAYGLKNIKITFKTILILGTVLFTLTIPLIFFNNFFFLSIHLKFAKIISSCIFIFIGLKNLFDTIKKENPQINYYLSSKETIILGLSMSLDNILLITSLVFKGFNIYLLIFSFLIMHLFLFIIGNTVYKINFFKKHHFKFSLISSFIFFALGIYNIII